MGYPLVNQHSYGKRPIDHLPLKNSIDFSTFVIPEGNVCPQQGLVIGHPRGWLNPCRCHFAGCSDLSRGRGESGRNVTRQQMGFPFSAGSENDGQKSRSALEEHLQLLLEYLDYIVYHIYHNC